MRTNFLTYSPADFLPLERALTAEFGIGAVDASASFWFIGFAEGPVDVGRLRLYEHSITRRRIVLDSDGSTYRWYSESQSFGRCTRHEALALALTQE